MILSNGPILGQSSMSIFLHEVCRTPIERLALLTEITPTMLNMLHIVVHSFKLELWSQKGHLWQIQLQIGDVEKSHIIFVFLLQFI